MIKLRKAVSRYIVNSVNFACKKENSADYVALQDMLYGSLLNGTRANNLATSLLTRHNIAS